MDRSLRLGDTKSSQVNQVRLFRGRVLAAPSCYTMLSIYSENRYRDNYCWVNVPCLVVVQNLSLITLGVMFMIQPLHDTLGKMPVLSQDIISLCSIDSYSCLNSFFFASEMKSWLEFSVNALFELQLSTWPFLPPRYYSTLYTTAVLSWWLFPFLWGSNRSRRYISTKLDL